MQHGSCKNQRFGGTCRLHHQGDKNRRARNSVRRLLVTANVVLSSQILVALMTEALRSSETSVLTKTTRRNISDDGIRHSQRSENLISYIALTGKAQ
jgi:hypothetical protein